MSLTKALPVSIRQMIAVFPTPTSPRNAILQFISLLDRKHCYSHLNSSVTLIPQFLKIVIMIVGSPRRRIFKNQILALPSLYKDQTQFQWLFLQGPTSNAIYERKHHFLQSKWRHIRSINYVYWRILHQNVINLISKPVH